MEMDTPDLEPVFCGSGGTVVLCPCDIDSPADNLVIPGIKTAHMDDILRDLPPLIYLVEDLDLSINILNCMQGIS